MAKTQHGHQKFYQIIKELQELHSRKNHDYAQEQEPLSNLRQSEKMGIPAWKGCLVRMGDKFDRLCNFARQATLEVEDEKITDTLNDLAVYAVLCRILYEECSH